MIDKGRALRQLGEEIDRYHHVLVDADFAAPVEPCPGWAVQDLNAHMGVVHRWATGIVRSGERASFDGEPEPGRDAGIAWFDEGAAALLELLAVTDLEMPCWGFGSGGTAEFWFRRQLQEIFVHRIDLEEATSKPGPRSSEIASDGIDEVLEVFVNRMAGRGKGPALPAPISFECTDAEGAWTLAPDLSFTREATASAKLAGGAVPLLLLLWNRIDLNDPRIAHTGDPSAIDALRTGQLVP